METTRPHTPQSTTERQSPGSGYRATRAGLVDADWLEAHLGDPKVRMVEVDVSATAHQAGHVPGAVLWDIYNDLKDGDYQLRDRASLHAGGSVHLRAGARRRSAGTVRRRRAGGPSTVLTAIDQAAVTVVDVRSLDEFDAGRFWPSGGMAEGGRAGHVPGARHVPVDGLTDDDGSFRPTSELAGRYAGLDPSGHGEIITYCTIGARAATVWFVLTYLLGRDPVRVYDGSWAEWGLTSGLPVER